HADDPPKNALIAIVGQNRRVLTMIDLEAGLDRLGPVVGAADEFAAAAYVADPLAARPVIPLVIARAALRAGEPARQPIDERRLVDVEQDHMVEFQIMLSEHRVERLCLRNVARKPVEDEATNAIRRPDTL